MIFRVSLPSWRVEPLFSVSPPASSQFARCMYTILIMQQRHIPPLPVSLAYLGSVFPGIDQVKDALIQHIVAKGLSYRLKSSDKRRYIVECRSESCAFFRIQKQETAKMTVSTQHTCPPETHFGWKQAGGALGNGTDWEFESKRSTRGAFKPYSIQLPIDRSEAQPEVGPEGPEIGPERLRTWTKWLGKSQKTRYG